MSEFFGLVKNNLDTEEQGFLNQAYLHQKDGWSYAHDDLVTFGFKDTIMGDHLVHEDNYSIYENEEIRMVFSGVVYNIEELRNDMIHQGNEFTSDSEHEVLAMLFQVYKEKMFEHLRGMFSILIWDKANKTMYGARDPFGMKPLFYHETKEGTGFSTNKKFLVVNDCKETLPPDALQHYFSFQYVPEPLTMTKGVKKIEPGYYFIKAPHQEITFHRYWQATFTPVYMEKNDWIKRIQEVMYDSVEKHMKSDDPVGSLLSGGIDSTLIVSIAKEINPSLKTFSVGFEREGFSEIDVAKQTADALGIENISYVITPGEFIGKLPEIMWNMDDPLADPACVPLYFATREARKHVSVALSGEGSDELFGGYNIYREPQSLKVFDYIPNPVKNMLGSLAKSLPEGMKGKSFLERGTTPLHERYIGNAKIFEEHEKKQFLRTFDQHVHYRNITNPLFREVASYPPVHQMQYVDIQTWMRGDILLKASKMSQANSLELRSPFLDKEVFDVAHGLPVDLKIANGTTKHILRVASRGIIPDHVLDRKKLGFPVPIRHWLKQELNDWANQLIRESETDDLFNKQYIKNLLDDHCQGKGDYSRKLWTIFMFMLWHQLFIEDKFGKKALFKETMENKVETVTL